MQNSLSFFQTPAGEILYSFFIIILTTGGIYTTVISHNFIINKTHNRALITFWMVIVLQIIYTSVAFASEYSLIPKNLQEFIQPFIITFSFLWLIWLWIFPSAENTAWGPKSLLSLVIIPLFTLETTVSLYHLPQEYFFSLYNHLLWSTLQIIIITFCFITLLIKREKSWVYGSLFIFFT